MNNKDFSTASFLADNTRTEPNRSSKLTLAPKKSVSAERTPISFSGLFHFLCFETPPYLPSFSSCSEWAVEKRYDLPYSSI